MHTPDRSDSGFTREELEREARAHARRIRRRARRLHRRLGHGGATCPVCLERARVHALADDSRAFVELLLGERA